MNRRGFFATLAAAAAARVFPVKRPAYEPPRLTPLGRAHWWNQKDLEASSSFRLRDIREAVATLRANNIEAGADGMLQVPIFVDDEFQRLNTALPRYTAYRRFSPFDFEVPAS